MSCVERVPCKAGGALILAALFILMGLVPAAAMAQGWGARERADRQMRPMLADAEIAEALHNDLNLNGWSLIDIAPLEAHEGRMEIQLPIGGRVYDVRLAAHSLFTDDFQLSLCAGDGRLVAMDAPAATTYRGSVAQAPEAQVAASIRHGQLDAFILLDGQVNGEATWYIQPLSRTIADAPRQLHVLYNAADVRHHGWHCGGALEVPGVHQDNDPPSRGGGGDSPDWFRVARVAIDADYAYFGENNFDIAETASDVQAVMNNTSLIYELEVGVTFRISELIIRQTDWPYIPGTGGGDLLRQFTDHWNANHQNVDRALAHLFTGIDNRPTLGVAWLSTVCSPTHGYAFSQSRFSENMILRTSVHAHEFGHNFSARHCNQSPTVCDPCAIMCASVGCMTHGTFGCSASIIASYAATRPCLDTISIGEAITPPRAVAGSEAWAYTEDYTQVLSGDFHVTGFRLQADAEATGGWALQGDMLMHLVSPDGTELLIGAHGGDPVPGAVRWDDPSLSPRGNRPLNSASAQTIDVVYSFDFGPVAGVWRVNFWNNWHGSGTLDWDEIRIIPIVVGNEGACCLDGGSCIVVDVGQCDILNGDFHGAGTLCSTACPMPTDVILPPDFTAFRTSWAFTSPHVQYLTGLENVTGFHLQADAEPTGTAAYQSDLLMRLVSPDGTVLLIGADEPPAVPGAVPWSEPSLNPTPLAGRPRPSPVEQTIDVTYTFPFGPMEGDWSVNFWNNFGHPGSAITWRNVEIRPMMDGEVGACCFPSGACAVRSAPLCASQGGFYQGDGVSCAVANCDQPTGACCFANGTCAIRTPVDCDNEGGSYRGHGVDCAAAQCQDPSGACCFADATCEILSAVHCDAEGGVYQGDDVTCEAANCTETAGACCFADGSCLVLTAVQCGEMNGDYKGDDVPCSAVNCPKPTGACCFTDGSCDALTAAQCSSLNGLYRGDGVACSAADCPQPLGACCLPSGGCQFLTQATCTSQSGVYRGDSVPCSGASCAPAGACCFLNTGACSMMTSALCTSEGGNYRGHGVTCGAADCEQPAGACCLADGSCQVLTVAQCADLSGSYQGTNVTCAAANCQQPTGACCFSDNTCSIQTAAACVDAEGLYMGDGVTCAAANCVQPAGGCCFADGSCEVLTQLGCAGANGTFAGSGVSCLAANCPKPSGACCFGDGTCAKVTETECLVTAGIYQGDGVECQNANCEQPTGACCLAGGDCDMLTRSQCGGQGGSYMGDNIDCATAQCHVPPRACCLPDGSCLMLTVSACWAQNGAARAPGASCVDGCSDLGACCMTSGLCRLNVQASCTLGGGTFAGLGVYCPQANCPDTAGACCFQNGTCEVLTPSACDTELGSYSGDNVTCLQANCPVPCYADCNGDGELNVSDFLCFIDNFAFASTLPPAEQMRHYANCTGSASEPYLSINDFLCFIDAFAGGCP